MGECMDVILLIMQTFHTSLLWHNNCLTICLCWNDVQVKCAKGKGTSGWDWTYGIGQRTLYG